MQCLRFEGARILGFMYCADSWVTICTRSCPDSDLFKEKFSYGLHHHHHHHLSFNSEGRWGTTDDFTTSFLHFFSVARWAEGFHYELNGFANMPCWGRVVHTKFDNQEIDPCSCVQLGRQKTTCFTYICALSERMVNGEEHEVVLAKQGINAVN